MATSNWRKAIFDDLVRLKRGYDLPNEKIVDGLYPVVASSNIKTKHNQYKVEPPGVVTGRSGTLGIVQLVKEKFWPLNTALYAKNFRGNDLKFVYYFLTIMKLENFNAGAGVPTLNQNHLHKIPVLLPVIEEQKKIAAVLSAYDDLIENNKRRIALLERMAEEIYREWFVRFRFPDYQKTEFKKGIPKEWNLRPFSDVVNINPTERPFKEDEKPYVGMEALSTNSMYFESTKRRTGNSGSKFRNGDTLFPRITPCLENGKRGFTMTLEDEEVAIGSTEFIVMREKILPPEFIYLLCSFEPFRTHAEISMVGASGRQRVAESCFSFFFISTPPDHVLKKFIKIVRPMFEKIKLLSKKNSVLTDTRQQLLPRLISGKLSVENLDIQFPPSMMEEEPAS